MTELEQVTKEGVPFVNLYDENEFNKASLYFLKKQTKYANYDLYYFVYHSENGEPASCCMINNKVYPRLVTKHWDKSDNINYKILNMSIFNKWKRSKDTGPKYTSPVSPVNGLETEVAKEG